MAPLDPADLAYVAKLRQSKRDKKLIASFILLVLALKHIRPSDGPDVIAAALAPATTVLAGALAVYVANRMHAKPEKTRAIAVPLLAAVALHAAQALQLGQDERVARLGLIARAELQHATMAASKRAAQQSGGTLLRELHSGNPCEECLALAGSYDYPYPDEVWYWHPNCACSISIDGGDGA